MLLHHVVILASFAGLAASHAHVYGISVNGVDAGDGRKSYIRSPPNNNPVKDVASPAIICNVANTPAPSSVPANPGDKIDIEWYHNTKGDDIIAASHRGPVLVYLAPAEGNGAGAVWTKIAEQGIDGVDKLIANKGKHSATLPAGIAPGSYLLRAEIIGLHEAEVAYSANPARGAQFYPSCIQLKVGGSGSTKLAGGFDFQKGYSSAPTNEGIVFNIYGGNLAPYPIPGPKVSAGGGGADTSAGGASPQAGGSTPPADGSAAPAGGAPPAGGSTPPAGGAPPADGSAPPQSSTPPTSASPPADGSAAPAGGSSPPQGGAPATSGVPPAPVGALPGPGGASPAGGAGTFPGFGGGMFGGAGAPPSGFRVVRVKRSMQTA